MKKIKIGVICPSEIAYRRFMPALSKNGDTEYVGIAVNSIEERYGQHLPSPEEREHMLNIEIEHAENFRKAYGGKIFHSYKEIVTSDEIDAIYIPLPPSLHYKWAKAALESGKHVLVEKPSTISFKDTKNMIRLAEQKDLALHENYMFMYHSQLETINEIISSGEIGEVRLYQIRFGFPKRSENDFRYVKALGGGALIDAGGYTIKYAVKLLGHNIHVRYAQMNYIDGFEVDMYGSAAFSNDRGDVVQVAYGMDNNYKCELEVWGSKGTLTTGRVLTAPAGFEPSIIIRKGNECEERLLPSDDTFKKSIERFIAGIQNVDTRKQNYLEIEKQAKLIDEFRDKAGR